VGGTVFRAESTEQLRRCFPVVRELRTHLDEASFLAQVTRQQQSQNYAIAYVDDDDDVVAVAGYRMGEYLAWGKAVYVDDLVTTSTRRSAGYGGLLLDWLIDLARQAGCQGLHLDSGVQRFEAHRFYLNNRMAITSHHCELKLS
jgi:GNAT superfamily N-acetyltransferase